MSEQARKGSGVRDLLMGKTSKRGVPAGTRLALHFHRVPKGLETLGHLKWIATQEGCTAEELAIRFVTEKMVGWLEDYYVNLYKKED